MDTMRAITYSRYGPPDVLRVEEVPRPAPGDDEILLWVHAAEATKSDCELRGFRFSVKWFWLPLRLGIGVFRPRRSVLGGYFAGEVVAVGGDVQALAVGDEVFGATGIGLGAYGEFMLVPAKATLAHKPRNMSFVEAAAVPLGGLNALHFMRRAKIEPGDAVLVIGAGGSIGGHAVQIAKAMGAEVTAVDHGRKRGLAQELGADHFVDYTKETFVAVDRTYDVVFDMVPTSSYSACMRVLKTGGRYLCGNPRLSVMFRCLLTNWFSNKSASFAFARESRAELQDLVTMIEAGEIRPFVDKVYSMDQAAEAHHVVETEQRLGTVVIALDDARTNSPAPLAERAR